MTLDEPGALRGLAQLIGGLFVDELARGAVFFDAATLWLLWERG